MCVPGCRKSVLGRLSRRGFMGGGALALGAAAMPLASIRPARAQGFTRVVDLTHTLGPDFPTFSGDPGFGAETIYNYAEHGLNMYRWSIVEHTGTHMDAPIHFAADAQTADEVPIEHLVVPLAVVDIREKAESDADAQVTPEDLAAWEAVHGPLPDGACVAMNSGWDRRADGAGFANRDDKGVLHFPGFHVDAAQWLIEERNVIGMVVDTLSLDHGPSTDFPVHYLWLPSNRWGMEAVANLSELPPVGATIVAAGPKIRGATGGPSRVLALV